jgi:hypothetical protein
MRTMILAVGTGMVLGLMAPVPGAAQGPPPHAEAQREQARGQQAERGQSQRARQEQATPQAQRPQEAQRPPQAQGQPGQRPPQAQGQADQRGPGAARSAVRRGGPAPALDSYNRGLAERVVRARSQRHGQAPTVEVRREGGNVRLVRTDGREIFSMPERTADRLGYWRAVVAPPAGAAAAAANRGGRYPTAATDPPRNGAPAFCRSGEGHPVWGRDWCLDKGFGLGDGQRAWAVTRPIEDIIFGRPDPRERRIEADRLGDLLGEIVLGRLAFQSVVLGGTDPLTGLWMGDTEGPRTLRVMSGSVPVAELVDYDRNGRVDTLIFNLGR